MIEPTESESKSELDRFCDAMLSIKSEIKEVVDEIVKIDESVLRNAPHTVSLIVSENWPFKYTRQTSSFPTTLGEAQKFWPSVRRINDAFGDRNLICSCAPISDFQD